MGREARQKRTPSASGSNTPTPKASSVSDDLEARLAELDRRPRHRRARDRGSRRAMEHVRSLEEDRDAVLADLEAMAPKVLDCLDPEERHRFYKMLRLKVRIWPDGSMEITGAFPEPLKVGAEVCTMNGSRLSIGSSGSAARNQC